MTAASRGAFDGVGEAMPSQTRATAIAFIATRMASAGEPSHIVAGSRLVEGRCRQFIGFFDSAGLDQWLRADGPLTPNDALNCVFQSFPKDEQTGAYELPFDFPQSTLAQAGLFARPVGGALRTICVPDISRIAYFVDGVGDRLQPFGEDWQAAIPRLILDLANPASIGTASGSSILVVLPSPGTSRKRPSYLIVDHRMRHLLNAHATGDMPGEFSRSAAALQTWHANVDDPWLTHGSLRYSELAFWAAGVSERNREDSTDLARSWGWTQIAKVGGLYPPTTLYALASDRVVGAATLEGMLRAVAWRRADGNGGGIPAVRKIGIRPNAETAPVRGFGLQRIPADHHNPMRLAPVLFGDFPIETATADAAVRSLALPSGFNISAVSALNVRRPLRAVQVLGDVGNVTTAEWLRPGSTVNWQFSLEIPAEALDKVPTSTGRARPLEALRDLLSSHAQARAVARGMPPFTFAPHFSLTPGFAGDFCLNGTLSDLSPARRTIDSDELALSLRASFRLSESPGRATWPAVQTHAGAALSAGNFFHSTEPTEDEETLLGEDLGESDSSELNRFLSQRVVLRIAAAAGTQDGDPVRIGALDLTLRRPMTDAPAPLDGNIVRVTLAPAISRIGGQQGMRVRVIASFPAAAARPARPDRPPADRDMAIQAAQLEDAPELPLLLPLATAPSIGVTGSLRVAEAFGWGLDPQLSLSLTLREPVGGPRSDESWFVLGRVPMQVARLEMPPLSRRANAATGQVAVWSSGAETGGSWRLRDPEEAATIILGPQGIGEAMEKGRSEDGYIDIVPDRPAGFRLTPPAVIEIDPSPLDSGFVEPSWNLDRIFGRPGIVEPGARLKRAAYELLYGMVGAISDRGLKNGQLRLSDTAARYGIAPTRLARPLSDSDTLLGAWIDDWNSLRRVTFTRPLSLAVSRTDRLDGFELDGPGVDFRLRTSARLKYPIPNVPVPEHGPWTHPSELDATQPSDEGHLPGGAGWAFESPNIVQSVYAAPRSNAGRVRDLVLTPLGGYGNVRGLFDNRRTAIEATVALGRTHFFALERVGRIGALWNKAKHVIIYRREVVPPGQFYNEAPIGLQQDQHAGRAVLRKWEEFIEILQPQRNYPDLADVADRTGFVRGSHFQSQRIRVDSRWGADVAGAGWMVPLWRSVFRELKVSTEDSPAAIYPMPQISLVCAGRDGQEHEQEIRYPENLIFFASTRLGETDDTDAWTVTAGIDWADELWPEVPSEHGSGSQPHDARLSKPAVAPLEHGRFVVELLKGQPVAVAHGFDEEPPLAAIDSVTISRASPVAPPAGAAAPKTLAAIDEMAMIVGDARAVIGNLKREIETAPLAEFSARQRGELVRRSREAKNALSGISEAAARLRVAAGGSKSARDVINDLDANALVQQGCDELKRALRSAIDTRLAAAKADVVRFTSRLDSALQVSDARLAALGAAVSGALSQAASDIDSEFAALLMMLDRVEYAGLEAGTQASGRIAAVRDEIVRMVEIFDGWRQAQAEGREFLETLIAQAAAAASATADAFSQECLGLARSAQALNASAAAIKDGLESAIRSVEARQADVPADPASVRQAFADAVAALRHLKDFIDAELTDAQPGQPMALLQWVTLNARAWAGLPADQIDAVKGELQTRMKAVQQTLAALENDTAAKVGDLSREAATKLDNATAFVAALAQGWPSQVGIVRAEIEGWRTRIQAGLSRCAHLPSEGLASARAFIGAVRGEVLARQRSVEQTLTAGADALADGADALVDSIRAELAGTVGGWKTDLVAFLDNPAFGRVTDAVEAIASKLQTAADDLTAEITDLTNAADAAVGTVAGIAEGRRAELGRLIGAADRAASRAESVLQQGDRALALMRAVGDPPKVEMLDFNRPGVAYVYNALEQRGVRLSPVVAQVNRAASTVAAAGEAANALNDLLSEFGLRIPFRELGKTLTPDPLKDFDLSRIFPQMGGLDLTHLLGGEKFPSLGGKYGDAIQISHGFKPEEGRAWLACKVNTPLEEASGKPRRLFALGPVQLDLLKGHFGADARFEGRADGGTSKKVTGAITGDWRLTAFGTRLVTFVDTGLRFDESGRFDFDVQADRIQLADALQSLVQLLKTFGGEVASRVRPIEADGRIVGMTAPFTLSIADLEFGAFAVSAIQINCEFTVIAAPDFLVSVRTDVNSKMSPFALSVGTMIGGGYLTSNTQIVPGRGEVTQRMSVAVMAGIGRSLNIAGIARGHGYLQFGVEAELYFSTRSGGAGGAVIPFVIASGDLVILGVVNCNITLRLETRFDTAGGASANGQLSVHIKISFFYTLNVERAADYRLSGGGGGSYADSFA